MLYEQFFEPCQHLQKHRKPDGEGGWITNWLALNEFEAAVVLDTSTEAVLAASANMNRTYTVTCPVGTKLGFHDVFKRVSDGKTFRVTSDPNDLRTPSMATMQFEIVKAEAWGLPNE